MTPLCDACYSVIGANAYGQKLVDDDYMVSVLIGINATDYNRELKDFQKRAGLTQYVDAGKATQGKLADFISQSVSLQSQALGTGKPSQSIPATI